MGYNNKHISAHHVGGRGGSSAFPVFKKFERDIINVLYDADPDCLAQIREVRQKSGSELYVLPYCLGESCKSTYFNINYDPYTSSLYDFNPDYKSYYYFDSDHDYILSETIKSMERCPVKVVTLDYIFQTTDTLIPAPDFLSIDTQGSEYEILLGGQETLKSSVVGVVLEAEFHPIYKGQKLFWDLVKLLSGQGFNFIRFLSLQELSPYRAAIGLRAEGTHICSEALFLRQVDNICSIKDQLRRYFMLRKLAFIAIIFNQFEYGVECLRQSKDSISHHSSVQEDELVYLKFLRELQQQIERMPSNYPPTFTLKYPTFEMSKSRFKSCVLKKRAAVDRVDSVSRIKQLLRLIPPLYLLLRWVRKIFNKLFLKLGSIPKLRSTKEYTNVESILVKYGLKTHADLLRKNRIIQTGSCENRSILY